jgi:protein gp37
MSDLFHEKVEPIWQFMVIDMAIKAPQHTYMILTKRPERMHEFFTDNSMGKQLAGLPNVWLGVTAENQTRAEERIPILLQTPAAKRFVSCEPLLGPIDLSAYIGTAFDGMSTNREYQYNAGLDWIITGAETGPGARPMDPAWARDIRDQCKDANVPFFFKQMSNKTEIPPDLMVREWPG